MGIQPFLLMSEEQAARFREDTLGDDNQLDPRQVEAGDHAGWYALPRTVMLDQAFAARRDALELLTEADLDPETAWPPPPFPAAA